MTTVRIMLGDLFSAPVQRMNYAEYMRYVNTAGKVTNRSLMDITTVLLTKLEEQEQQLELHEKNFAEIKDILAKLVDKKLDKNDVNQPQAHTNAIASSPSWPGFKCETCGKELSTKLALAGHSRSHKSAKV